MAKWESAPLVEAETGGGDAPKWASAPLVETGDTGPLVLPTQAMSGVNEGLANFLSLPNSIELGLRSIGPAIGNLMGGEFQMPTESMLPDAGANYRAAATEIGAIRPEVDDPSARFVRRAGQEVGANLLPIAAMPAKVAATVSTLGSGLGAAGAERFFPGNPAAELAGQMLGGLGPAAIFNQAERGAMRRAAPSADDLQDMKRVAYQTADNLGVGYTPQGMADLSNSIAAATAKASPIRHANTTSMVDDIRKWTAGGMTLTQLDELRQVVRRDLIRSGDEANAHFGEAILDEIDDFIAKAGGPQVAGGNAGEGARAITAARELNTRWRKTQMVEDAVYRAGIKTGNSGSGGNADNTLRQAFSSILLSPKKRASFTAEEIGEMEAVVKRGKGEDLLRLLGKLSPSGNGLSAWAGIFAASQGYGAVPAAGMVAKAIADRNTIGRAADLRANVARGGSAPTVPAITPNTQGVVEALLTAQAANQNAPRSQVVDALAAARAGGR